MDLSVPEQQQPEATEVGNRLIVGNFHMQMQMPNNASINTTGMIYLDDDEESLNARMDHFRKCIQRQQEISEIPTLQANISQIDVQLEQMSHAMDAVGKKQKSGKKLTSQDQQQADNLPNSIKMLMDHRAKGVDKISELKAKHGIA